MAIIQVLQRSVRPLLCLGLLSASTWSFAAVPTPQIAVPQITQAVNNRQRITLKGNVRPMPKRAQDLGAVDINAPAGRVLLLLKRPAEQEAALQQFIQDAHTPGSASYHHWLTPAQLGSQFGPAESDVQAVVAWLQSQGFAVSKVSQARTTIEFSGSAGQIESAFATKIHSFQIDGVSHISNIVDPQIPAALAPVIAGISPLNDFRPKPMHTAPVARTLVAAPTSANPHAMTSVARNAQSLSARPNYTDNVNHLYVVTPADFATIYNTPNQTLNKNYAASKNLTGTGVTIGIAGDSNVDLSNVANYRKLFGLPALTPTVTIDGSDPGTGSGDEVEALLDLEVASGVAPGANLTLYTAQDTTFQSGLILAIQRALDDNAINILNVSFGGCEAYQGTAGNQQILNLWQQAAAQGISVTVSTGDSGSAGCDDSNSVFVAAQGLQVNGFASTPYNIAVGGTDFDQDQSTIAQYWSATNSSIAGSALKYIPEIPWDDSTTTIGSLTGNVAFTGHEWRHEYLRRRQWREWLPHGQRRPKWKRIWVHRRISQARLAEQLWSGKRTRNSRRLALRFKWIRRLHLVPLRLRHRWRPARGPGLHHTRQRIHRKRHLHLLSGGRRHVCLLPGVRRFAGTCGAESAIRRRDERPPRSG